MSYDITYIWNIKNDMKLNYLQNINRLTDIANKLMVAAAAAAKSIQSCLTLCDPTDGSAPGSPVPEVLQARTLEWGAVSFSSA